MQKIYVLISNAGVMAIPALHLTVDGCERTIATMQWNHLGHFALTSILASKLSQQARIVKVSLAAHQIARGMGLLEGDALWTLDISFQGL